jgi:hypothetical protein
MCDSSLHLVDYEADLASLESFAANPRLTIRVLQQRWDWAYDMGMVVAIEVKLTNTTDSRIRIASVGLTGSRRSRSPRELPVLGAIERNVLDNKVAALRIDRYSQELGGIQAVPPRESVSSWVITTMDLSGSRPQLNLTVREAGGTTYLTVIPPPDPEVSST